VENPRGSASEIGMVEEYPSGQGPRTSIGLPSWLPGFAIETMLSSFVRGWLMKRSPDVRFRRLSRLSDRPEGRYRQAASMEGSVVGAIQKTAQMRRSTAPIGLVIGDCIVLRLVEHLFPSLFADFTGLWFPACAR